MADGFELAGALVARARELFEREMPQHQWESFQRGRATTGFQVAIKEILDHLRSALDYCAREVCEHSGGSLPCGQKVYFPIVTRAFKPEDFRSVVGKLMPGVVGAREDLIPVLASFQEFSSPKDNAWLPDFASLSCENKHERLSLQRMDTTPGEVRTAADGTPVYAFRDPAGPRQALLFAYRSNPLTPGKGCVSYFMFDAVNCEVNSLLVTARDGVEKIVNVLREKV